MDGCPVLVSCVVLCSVLSVLSVLSVFFLCSFCVFCCVYVAGRRAASALNLSHLDVPRAQLYVHEAGDTQEQIAYRERWEDKMGEDEDEGKQHVDDKVNNTERQRGEGGSPGGSIKGSGWDAVQCSSIPCHVFSSLSSVVHHISSCHVTCMPVRWCMSRFH